VSDRVDQIDNIMKERGMEILFARVASNLLKKGNVDEAINICENGLKKFPYYAQAHYVLAACYLRKDLQREARNELERTLKYDPNHLRALKVLAELYNSTGMEELFKEKVQKLHYLDPLNPEISQLAKNIGAFRYWNTVETSEEEITDTGLDIAEVEKVDLSQFDNRQDDFNTIISGKKSADEQDQDSQPASENTIEGDEQRDKEVKPEEVDQELVFEELEELKFDKGDATKEFEENHWLESDSESDIAEVSQPETRLPEPEAEKVEQRKPDLEDNKIIPDEDETEPQEESAVQPKIVSQTLGEILVSQKKYTQALHVFEQLKNQHPENKTLDKKITFLKKIIALEQK